MEGEPVDPRALKHWDDSSIARDEMLARTRNPMTGRSAPHEDRNS